MRDEQTIEDLLARLERERLAADRLYNDALTAVDRALRPAPSLPSPPPAYDASRLPDLNASWNILPGGPPLANDRSLRGRLGRFIWRIVGPSLDTQKRFNAALVDHLNRNVPSHEATARATAALVDALGHELEALAAFESLLVQYLQTITVYVDSKDRSLGGAELRQRLALTEHRLLALKREVEGAIEGRLGRLGRSGGSDKLEGHGPSEGEVFESPVDSLTYVGFEDRFRGTNEAIRARVEDYVPILAQASDVVDVGCGRGELLALLREQGVRARGIDVNPAMVDLCRSRGFEAERGDALSFLLAQPDAAIGGLVAIQVVEHFAPAYLMKFLEAAFHAMRPGAPLVLETINPACWMAFFDTYIRDPTHRQPLHPDTLRYLVEAAGFSSVDVQYRAQVAEDDRLDRVPAEPPAATAAAGAAGAELAGTLVRLTTAINAHADKLNRLLFSSMDYVVVARR